MFQTKGETIQKFYDIQTVLCKTLVFHGRLSGFLQAHFLYNKTGKYIFHNFPQHFFILLPIFVKVHF
jgi:hypothetical protein